MSTQDDPYHPEFGDHVLRITEAIKPYLAGLGPEMQGAILANLTALWLAGHTGRDKQEVTALREAMLALHVKTVRDLIGPSEMEIAEMMSKKSNR